MGKRIAKSGLQLGRGIRKLRKQKNWKQSVLAEKVGLNVATISLIESSRTNPSYYDIENIAGALGTSVSGLIGAGKNSLNSSNDEMRSLVAERSSFRRNELGLSRAELAALTGFLPQYISTTELGRRLPLVRSLLTLAGGLQVRPSWLLGTGLLEASDREGIPITVCELGERLRGVRVQRGFTLDAACRASGLGFRHLERLESGEQLPTVATLLALKDGLGFAFGEILDKN